MLQVDHQGLPEQAADSLRRKEEFTIPPYNLANRWNIQDPSPANDDQPSDLGAEICVYNWIMGQQEERSREERGED